MGEYMGLIGSFEEGYGFGMEGLIILIWVDQGGP